MHLPCPRAARYRPVLPVVALVLVAAGLAASESALIVVDPVSTVATRIVVQGEGPLRAVLTARGGKKPPAARAGFELPWLVAGPATLAGTFAELARPAGGGPASPRWYAPAGLDLDASLVPGSRAGVFVRPVPAWGLAAWLADSTLTAAAAVGTRGDALFADAAVAASRPLALDAPGLAGLTRRAVDPVVGEDPLDASWFDGPPQPRRTLHAIVRAGAEVPRAAASAAVVASLPNATLPGVGARLAARAEPWRWMRVEALGSLASPDLREPSGATVDPAVRWEASASFGKRSTLTLGVKRAYAAPEASYAGVTLVPAGLTTERTDFEARISTRPGGGARVPAGASARGDRLVRLRSVSAGGSLRAEPEARLAWRAHARASLALWEGAVEIEPSLRLDASEGVGLRVRSVLQSGGGSGETVSDVALVSRIAYEVGPPWAARSDDAQDEGELTGGIELRLGVTREDEPTGQE